MPRLTIIAKKEIDSQKESGWAEGEGGQLGKEDKKKPGLVMRMKGKNSEGKKGGGKGG